ISRSSCAFVNYETEAYLQVAITCFNGVPLRADPSCARLVCRVRRRDDDLRAGVGGQRGAGMHTRWVQARQGSGHGQDQDFSFSALSFGFGDDDDGPTPPPRMLAGSNSSGSHASTNSSLLREHFPQRYFILKSLTRDALDLSVQTGVWATHKHNESVLDRAFRTSKDVFLIFGTMKSGEFYGYARMVGPIGQGEDSGRVTWAQRDSSESNTGASASWHSYLAPATQFVPMNVAGNLSASSLPTTPHVQISSVDSHVVNSPQPFPPPTSTPLPHEAQSAPAALRKPHHNLNLPPAANSTRLNQDLAISSQGTEAIELDWTAPFRAMRLSPVGETDIAAASMETGRSHEQIESLTGSWPAPALPESVAEEALVEGGSVVVAPRKEGWGENFKLQWLCTERLPFVRTRHIRNPWNHDREIKVSRDGTEIEESILEEWEWDSPISFFGKRVPFLIPSTMGLAEEMGLGRPPPIT
ncbi:YT521-B-like domain-containing protein, partial [Mycena olivaceomarginata]